MPRQAFARARRFLQHKQRQVWSALAAGVLLGLVYVAGLCVGGLLADLLANQGKLPAEQGATLSTWLNANLPDAADRKRLTLAHENGQGVGLVALAVRSAGDWYGPLFSALARNLPWSWAPFTYLTGLLALLLFLGLVHFAVSLLMNHWAAQAALDAAYRLRRTVYLHSLRLSKLTLRGLASGGEAVNVFAGELEAVQEGLFHWLTSTFKEPTKFILVLAFALTLDASAGVPWLSATALLLGLLLWLVGGRVASKYRIEEKTEAAAAAEQMNLMREALSLTRLVKAYGMDAFNQNRVERQLHRYAGHQNHRLMAQARGRLALQTLALIALVALLFVAGWTLLTGQAGWARTITLLVALGSLYLPLRRLLLRQKAMTQAYRSSQTLFKFLDTEGDVRQVVGAEFLAPLANSLEFDQVTVKEPGRAAPLLDRVSFKAGVGERLAFVGRDPESLRAIAYLIPRFLDPSAGEIRIDGRRLPWMTLESIRAQVGLVLLDDLVFNDSILNNIACGDPANTLPKVIEAAKMAHAHQFIMNLEAGYETPIGELGATLDLGERYRIALARAILRDPALVVIEEPPHADLDEDTKQWVDDTIERFLVGRTALFLPHRQSTTAKCNRVYLLHEGKIEAIGTHRELLQKSERYRHLQYLEFNVFAEES